MKPLNLPLEIFKPDLTIERRTMISGMGFAIQAPAAGSFGKNKAGKNNVFK